VVAPPVLAGVEPLDGDRLAVAVVTHNRAAGLRAVRELRSLPERPHVVVIDNGSTDRSADAVGLAYPDVQLVRLRRNVGAGARTVAASLVDAEYVAFCDDDSGWLPGSLTRAAALLDAHPELALVAAQILVGSDRRLDPACQEMARSPLPRDPLQPGVPVLGFIACGAVVRRSAFLEVGGFNRRFGIGGEERLLAIDLVEAGWHLAYVNDVIAWHRPDPESPRPGRAAQQIRDDLWTAWLRLPPADVLRATVGILRAGSQRDGLCGLVEALAGLPFVIRCRRPVGRQTAEALRLVTP
jgi:GT2 family glycosyltransferase